MTAPWLACPNTPPCPHSALSHDIWAHDDPRPACCVDGCDCGHAAVTEAARQALGITDTE